MWKIEVEKQKIHWYEQKVQVRMYVADGVADQRRDRKKKKNSREGDTNCFRKNEEKLVRVGVGQIFAEDNG